MMPKIPAKDVMSAREQNYVYMLIKANSTQDFFLKNIFMLDPLKGKDNELWKHIGGIIEVKKSITF